MLGNSLTDLSFPKERLAFGWQVTNLEKTLRLLSLRVRPICLLADRADEAIPMLVVLQGLLRHYIPRKDNRLTGMTLEQNLHF